MQTHTCMTGFRSSPLKDNSVSVPYSHSMVVLNTSVVKNYMYRVPILQTDQGILPVGPSIFESGSPVISISPLLMS